MEVARYWRVRNRFRIEGIKGADGEWKIHICSQSPGGAWPRGRELDFEKAEQLKGDTTQDQGPEQTQSDGKLA